MFSKARLFMAEDRYDNEVRLTLQELRGSLETLSATTALNVEHAKEEREAITGKIRRLEEKVDRSIEELQKEVAKLIGKWSIVILLVSAMSAYAVTNIGGVAEYPGSVGLLPPKYEHMFPTKIVKNDDSDENRSS